MSKESAPTVDLHEQAMQGFEAAQAAAQANGNNDTMELGAATSQVTTLESVGNVVDGPFVQRATVIGNSPGNQGALLGQELNSSTFHRDNAGNTTSYEFKTGGLMNPNTGVVEYGRITRRDAATGEKRTQVFTNPDTARKFGTVIARQAERNEQNQVAA